MQLDSADCLAKKGASCISVDFSQMDNKYLLIIIYYLKEEWRMLMFQYINGN